MSSVNKVILVGNLGNTPEIRYAASGDAVANASLATSWKGNGEAKKVEWHRLVFFKRHAEIANQYLKKGSLVYIEGRLQTREWDDKGTKRFTTEVVVEKIEMMGGGPSQHGDAQERPSRSQMKRQDAQRGLPQRDDYADDIPF